MAGELLDWRISDQFPNLVTPFVERASAHPARAFTVQDGSTLTWGAALDAARGFAQIHGDRVKGRDVAVFMPNGTALLITYLSVLFSGGRPALLNAAMPIVSGQKLMEALAPELIFSDRVLPFSDSAIQVDSAMLGDWVACGRNEGAHRTNQAGQDEDPACSFYSGGTTGVPKRILYTQRQLVASAARMQWGWPLQEAEIFLPLAPFSHIYGFLMGVAMPLLCGGTSVIPPKFSPALVLDLLETHKVTVLGGGPPMIYQALMAAPDLATRDLSHLRVCPGGGASFPVEVHRRWAELTGKKIYEGLGMTEGAPIAVNTEETGVCFGTVGKVVPDSEIQIVDMETGTRVLPAGETGEIRWRGPHMMRGYQGNPEETALVLRDGWVHTGDVGMINAEGFLSITDRKKDVVVSKGFKIFPREVEEALMSNPSVAACCVVGQPNARFGEIVIAYVALRSDAVCTPEILMKTCGDYLVDYKMPAVINIIDAMPLTPAGKIDRMALRLRASDAVAA